MKKVLLGCAYILSGISLSIFGLVEINGDFGPIPFIIGFTLFLIGSILGFAGILDNK